MSIVVVNKFNISIIGNNILIRCGRMLQVRLNCPQNDFVDCIGNLLFLEYIQIVSSRNLSLIYIHRIRSQNNKIDVLKIVSTGNERKMSKVYNLKEKVDNDEVLWELFNYMLKLEKKKEIRDKDFTTISQKNGNTITTIDEGVLKGNQYTLFFNGEFDSNQTKYEKLSNLYKICVASRSRRVGLALHTFLRMIIDKHPSTFWQDIPEIVDEDFEKLAGTLSIKQIVKMLAQSNKEYSSQTDISKDSYVVGELIGYKKQIIIKRLIDSVDRWDIYRIGATLGVWDADKRYEDLDDDGNEPKD